MTCSPIYNKEQTCFNEDYARIKDTRTTFSDLLRCFIIKLESQTNILLHLSVSYVKEIRKFLLDLALLLRFHSCLIEEYRINQHMLCAYQIPNANMELNKLDPLSNFRTYLNLCLKCNNNLELKKFLYSKELEVLIGSKIVLIDIELLTYIKNFYKSNSNIDIGPNNYTNFEKNLSWYVNFINVNFKPNFAYENIEVSK
ncbi:hypothetical protein COBT_000818 [Conglomerata obtusa]